MQRFIKYTLISLIITSSTAFANFSAQQVKSVQSIIHSYLINHPEVLVQAYHSLQNKQQVAQRKHLIDTINQLKQPLFSDSHSPTINDTHYTATIVEFFDYQCEHCKAMNPTIEHLLKTDKQVRYIFKEFPIFGNNSIFAAKAAIAANEQGKFLAFHNALMAAHLPLTHREVLHIANKVGLNVAKLKKAMHSKKVTDELQLNLNLAEALRLEGTPAFLITNKNLTQFMLIPGAINKQLFMHIIHKVQAA